MGSHGLCSGHPKQVELLFADTFSVSSWIWQELRERRRMFLTRKCARQYLHKGVGEQLTKLDKELRRASDEQLTEQQSARISKALYHAHHRKFELRRILQHGEPSVRLPEAEHNFVLGLRQRPPDTLTEACALRDSLQKEKEVLQQQYDAVKTSLPQEVDIGALLAWLRTVRLRSLLCHVERVPAPALAPAPALPPAVAVPDVAAVPAPLVQDELVSALARYRSGCR